MANRKPLVVVSGKIKQLPTGDTLDAAVAGQDLYAVTNGEGSPIVIGTPVYVSAANTVLKAKADAAGTAEVFGLVYDASITNGTSGNILIDGVLTATTGEWDTICGTTGGLTAGTEYFLSKDTAGKLTATAPSAVGQYVTFVGRGVSTTEMRVKPERTITL